MKKQNTFAAAKNDNNNMLPRPNFKKYPHLYDEIFKTLLHDTKVNVNKRKNRPCA